MASKYVKLTDELKNNILPMLKEELDNRAGFVSQAKFEIHSGLERGFSDSDLDYRCKEYQQQYALYNRTKNLLDAITEYLGIKS